MIILISGLPGVGKSSFSRTLARKCGYSHYDMERAQTWPRPDLHSLWDASRSNFVSALASAHAGNAVLDWGFPPVCLPWITELKGAGVVVCWFYADEPLARKSYLARDPGGIDAFERQLRLIKDSGLPQGLGAIEFEAVTTAGYRDWQECWQTIQESRHR